MVWEGTKESKSREGTVPETERREKQKEEKKKEGGWEEVLRKTKR